MLDIPISSRESRPQFSIRSLAESWHCDATPLKDIPWVSPQRDPPVVAAQLRPPDPSSAGVPGSPLRPRRARTGAMLDISLADLEPCSPAPDASAPNTRYNLRPRVTDSGTPTPRPQAVTLVRCPTHIDGSVDQSGTSIQPCTDLSDMPTPAPTPLTIWQCLSKVFRQTRGRDAGSLCPPGVPLPCVHNDSVPVSAEAPERSNSTAQEPCRSSALITEWIQAPRFSIPAPARVADSVHDYLFESTTQAAQQSGGRPNGWDEAVQHLRSHTVQESTEVTSSFSYDWEVIPSAEWHAQTRHGRACVGNKLLDHAISFLTGHSDGHPLLCHHSHLRRFPSPETSDFWDSPLQLGALNVGFRGLKASKAALLAEV